MFPIKHHFLSKNLIPLSKKLIPLGKKLMVGAIYLDLSKAFETIAHGLLISKLSIHGASGRELEWFSDYLFGKSLFIVFFNDFIDNVNVSGIRNADDTVLFYSYQDIKKIEFILTSEMENIGVYCSDNELLLTLRLRRTTFGVLKMSKCHYEL